MLELPQVLSCCSQVPGAAYGHVLLRRGSPKSLLCAALGTAVRLRKAGCVPVWGHWEAWAQPAQDKGFRGLELCCFLLQPQ